jgi:hypothetical protein
MESLLSKFGISDIDLLLLTICPLLGAVGSIVGVAANHHSLVNNIRDERKIKLSIIDISRIKLIADHLQDSLEKLYSNCDKETIDKTVQAMSESVSAIRSHQLSIEKMNQYIEFLNQKPKPKIILRVILGLGLGLAISLYFLGAVEPNLNFIARLGLACLLLGYQAPRVWLVQENIIASALEKRMRTLLQDHKEYAK